MHKTDFATLTVLPCVTSSSMCFTDKYYLETSPNKLRSKFRTPTTRKTEFFSTLVNAVN